MSEPDKRWSVAYGAAIAVFLAAEISGLHGPRRGRTFTEQTRWAEGKLPGPACWVARVFILGFATWAGIHLAEGLK